MSNIREIYNPNDKRLRQKRFLTKWDYLQYFHEGEKWGNPDAMEAFLLTSLDRMRDKVGYPFIVLCGYATKGHVEHSQHYLGRAVDFYIKTSDLSYTTQINKIRHFLRNTYVATTWGRIPLQYFCGFGIYPQWKKPGFHFDTRGHKARWSYLNGKYRSFQAGMRYVREMGL